MPWKVIGKKTVEVKNYFCDGCGKEFHDPEVGADTYTEGCLKASFDFGYYSSRDGERFQYYFCQDCAEEVLKYMEILRRLKGGKKQ